MSFGTHPDTLDKEQQAELNLEILQLLEKHTGVSWMKIGTHENYPAAWAILQGITNELHAAGQANLV